MKTNSKPAANVAANQNTNSKSTASVQVTNPAIVNDLQSAKAPTATEKAIQKAAKAKAKKERSLFLKNWDTVKDNFRKPCGAYKLLYNNASEELQAALIDPATLFNDKELKEKKQSYFAYANKHAAKDGGVSPWFAYLWANAEMREYRAKAQKDDSRAVAIAKVQRTEKVARQNAATAKK